MACQVSSWHMIVKKKQFCRKQHQAVISATCQRSGTVSGRSNVNTTTMLTVWSSFEFELGYITTCEFITECISSIVKLIDECREKK